MNKSYLMVAGDKINHLKKLKDLKCDVAIVNLEDGVFDKKYALNLLYKYFSISGLRFGNKESVVRINPLYEGGIEEIKIINLLKPNAIRVSKIKTVEDVKTALHLIHKDIKVHLSIETKEGFENLSKLKIDNRIDTVYLGILDLLESIGLPQSLVTLENPTIDYLLSQFLIQSKIGGFHPVSFTYQDYNNTQEFEQWCLKVKKMGYTSKSCISPTQTDIVNRVFSLDSVEVEKARYIVKIFETQKLMGITGFSDDLYGFIDEPIYKNALLILNDI